MSHDLCVPSLVFAHLKKQVLILFTDWLCQRKPFCSHSGQRFRVGLLLEALGGWPGSCVHPWAGQPTAWIHDSWPGTSFHLGRPIVWICHVWPGTWVQRRGLRAMGWPDAGFCSTVGAHSVSFPHVECISPCYILQACRRSNVGSVKLSFLPSSMHFFYFCATLRCYIISDLDSLASVKVFSCMDDYSDWCFVRGLVLETPILPSCWWHSVSVCSPFWNFHLFPYSWCSLSWDYILTVIGLRALKQLDDLFFLKIQLQLLEIIFGGKSNHINLCIFIKQYSLLPMFKIRFP